MPLPQKLSPLHFIVILVAIIASVLLVLWLKPERAGTMRPVAPTRVVTTEVAQTDLRPSYRVTGQLAPMQRAALHFEVAGRLVARHVEPGQRVQAGEVLLELDAGDYSDAVRLARAQLQQEQATVARDSELLRLAIESRELQQQEVKRLQRLGSESLTSQSRLDEARQKLGQLAAEAVRLEYAVNTAGARISQRRVDLARAERNLARARLSAPFAGVINRVEAEVGEYMQSNRTVVELLDDSKLDLALEVSGAVAAALRPGQSIAVQLDGRDIEGTLVALQSEPDSSTHTHALRVRIEAPGLMPGTLADVLLPLSPQRGVLVVPVPALLHDAGDSYLFTLEGDTVRRVAVDTGIRDGERQVVRGNIAAGTTIVARDVAALADGQRVEAR